MIIKRYSCKRFAGIKNKQISFNDNLNVILGPNEAGKSTLIEGIYAVLFKPSKLGFKSVEDKEFRSKFMPLPSGDSIDGEVTIANANGDYVISREWGEKPSAELQTPDAQLLKNEESINSLIKQILVFGEGTYGNIVFTKQAHIKSAIEKIIQNKDATGEVSTLLRKAIMELDGVSLDALKQKIDIEIDGLLKRWDVTKNYPEGNRGVNNPYLTGFGKVVESFYRKENIRQEIAKAQKAEERLEDLFQQLEKSQATMNDLNARKESMASIEDDVIKRARLEPQVLAEQGKNAELSGINQNWPAYTFKLEQLALQIEDISQQSNELDAQKALASQFAEKLALESLLGKIDGINAECAEISQQLQGKRITNIHHICFVCNKIHIFCQNWNFSRNW